MQAPGATGAFRQRAFTLLELMIVVAVIGILATIALPQYQSALRTARMVKSKQDLRTISQAVDSFLAANGRLPLTLYEVGYGGRRDAWGLPFCYLNYQAGTGDGLEWAVAVGLVDPGALRNAAARRQRSLVDGDYRPGAQGPGRAGGIGRTVSEIAGPVGPPGGPSVSMNEFVHQLLASRGGRASLVESLSGHAMFFGVTTETVRRRDQYLFPLNSDYDLFSLGPNGQTAASLHNPLSTDDIIRANNGGFFGVAADY